MAEDTLTNTQGRAQFFAVLRRQCEQTSTMGSLLGLLIVDVNRFRKVNEAMGYRGGDQVLKNLAGILRSVARKKDNVARIGDDQFALILPGLMNEGHAVLAATKLLRSLETPMEIDLQSVRVKITVGIALCPEHGSHGEVLLRKAEEALAAARSAGLAYGVAKKMQPTSLSGGDLEFELQEAIAADELRLHYQPKIELATRKPVGVEALVRWKSSLRGDMSPAEFIPVAEQTGLIVNMTQWAINTALREAQEWPTRFGDLSVAVNISAGVLNNGEILDVVSNALGLWSFDPARLVLEVTETSAMADPESSFALFRELRETGVSVSLDDFGTGYSSLAYFRTLAADELKLDMTFVQRMLTSRPDLTIARLAIELAHRFKLRVVAEGVEEVQTFKLLRQLGCDHAQGHLIGRPISSEALSEWLLRFQGLARSVDEGAQEDQPLSV